jgi:hypothetical protein
MLEKYFGLVLVGVVLYYVFKNPTQTGNLVAKLADANAKSVAALQGRPVTAGS